MRQEIIVRELRALADRIERSRLGMKSTGASKITGRPHRNHVLKLMIITKFGTQSDFAMALGINESVVSCVVNGRRNLNKKAQIKWAELLEYNVGKLFYK